MSDKYITYGPGKDIDPGKHIFSLSSPLERTLFEALQQREEMIQKAIQIAYDRWDSVNSNWAEQEVLREIIDALGGTDGE